MTYTYWTNEEVEYLEKKYNSEKREILISNLNHGWEIIKNKASFLGLTRRHFWINNDIDYLKTNYFDEKKEILMSNLNHSWISIKNKASFLKLKRKRLPIDEK